jgi:predicted short-subunit dehydrogenase-like oxidoreductase (DUF2520 family)
MRVALLGQGRLGRSLALLLPRAGVAVTPWSRGQPLPEADVHWVCVRDDAIAEVAAQLPRDSVVLHASGALGPEVLGDRPHGGVLHPLMTFPGPEVGLPSLEGVGAAVGGPAVATARMLATRLGMVPFVVPGDRRAYHAAASLASGHLAALFLDAAAILARAGVADPAARLLPLAVESLRRAAEEGAAAITGPAARGDTATMRAHLAVLTEAEREVYEDLTRRILSHRARPSDP